MKHVLLILFASIQVMTYAQSQVQVHLSAGVKFLQETNLAHSGSVIPRTVNTMGGGLSWVKNRIMAGGEFSFIDGVKESDNWRTVLAGMNFNLLAGYRISINERTKLLLQSGFGYGLQHASVSDNHFKGASPLNTAMYHNFIITLPLSATIQCMYENGAFIGVRASYGINMMSNDWRHMNDKVTDRFSAGVDGLNLQVILGGLLRVGGNSR